MTLAKRPLALIILDGFGYSEDEKYNAIRNANAPTWGKVWKECPNTLIATSGLAVGLPEGQMGNSEVGHMTLGSGRVIYQNFTRINKAIEDGDFFENDVYAKAVDAAVKHDKAVHILGLASPGGVHSHENHILAMLELAAKRGAKKVYIHAILDGRDCPPRSAASTLETIESKIASLKCGKIASLIGRYYAMDRDKRWDRVKSAYDLITHGKSEHTANTAANALSAAYERDENDEFVAATAIPDENGNTINMEDGDVAIFMNFRPDRARELSYPYVQEDFSEFDCGQKPKLADFVTTTEYAGDIPASCAFPSEDLVNSFGEVLSKLDKKQLRISETEKYAHVTFFFSGGRETEYEGEERILIPSPKVETYDLQPEMSSNEVTEKLVKAIESGKYDAVICNYANCDMVGHTGEYDAAKKAVEAVDKSLAAVFAALEKVDGEALITADHGNAELMFDEESQQVHTQHTTGPVPLVYVGRQSLTLKSNGSLANIAPTMLDLMDIEKPEEMSGESLVARS